MFAPANAAGCRTSQKTAEIVPAHFMASRFTNVIVKMACTVRMFLPAQCRMGYKYFKIASGE